MTDGPLETPAVVELHRVAPDDTVYDILESNDLPTADIETSTVRLFEALYGDELIGIGGFELHGTSALLRSIVVKRDAREEGFGTVICRELEDYVAYLGGDVIYLSTTSADGFFERLGYERITRDDAPGPIQNTQEFAELCDSTAVCMGKPIQPGQPIERRTS